MVNYEVHFKLGADRATASRCNDCKVHLRGLHLETEMHSKLCHRAAGRLLAAYGVMEETISVMIVDSLVVGALQVNCYVLGCEETQEAVVIDPGDQPDDILRLLARRHWRLTQIINTHAHFDHIMGVRAVKSATGAPFYLHQADLPYVADMRQRVMLWLGYDPGEAPTVDGYLTPGERVHWGRQALEMRWTPGHSPGSISFVDHAGRQAFVGDALFAGSIGRTDLPGGNLPQLLSAIRQQILSLPDDYAIWPGHGPATTVDRERRTNPFLNDFDDEAEDD